MQDEEFTTDLRGVKHIQTRQTCVWKICDKDPSQRGANCDCFGIGEARGTSVKTVKWIAAFDSD